MRNLIQNNLKILMLITWLAFFAFVASLILIIRWYNSNLKPVDRQQTQTQSFLVDREITLDELAINLENADLIRDAAAFKWHLRIHNQHEQIKEGVFELSPSFYASEIANRLVSGILADVNVLIPPEVTIKDLEASLTRQGFQRSDIQLALQKQTYANHDLIKNVIPDQADLEGYITPETFAVNQFNAESAQHLIRRALDYFQDQCLTTDVRQALMNQFDGDEDYIHKAVILASIIEKEIGGQAELKQDRDKVAQVFLKRYHQNIRLDSDVTFEYADKITDSDLGLGNPSPYNTRIHKGLPPSPISNVSCNTIKAVAYPAETDFLFFFTGDDCRRASSTSCTFHFNQTLQGHTSDAAIYCSEGCH
ncbi:MAG: endolytic transglycosylase MltG [Candidatus Saccharibacteria bacterium]|nr:endolytic transglycosylase MltG [Candidatus Saccharibacteria bacterium]MCY4010832.1 endolytic transglycosylase MltG [Candidatus Saccharibacteria bacterium]